MKMNNNSKRNKQNTNVKQQKCTQITNKKKEIHKKIDKKNKTKGKRKKIKYFIYTYIYNTHKIF